MNVFHSIFLGAIEGFTEFLPISSTAHLFLASKLLDLQETDFLKNFIIAIQFGSILAVLTIYWKTFLKSFILDKKILAAFLPTAIIGLFFYKFIKTFLLGNTLIILAALFIGGILMIIFEYFYQLDSRPKTSTTDMPYWKAIIIGCIQALAAIPGVSRSAATIIGGLILGIEKNDIVEFSFLLAVPTMAAAAGYDLFKNASSITTDQIGLLAIGFISAFCFAFLGIKFFIDYIKTQSFANFGIYRIIIAILLFSFFLL